MSAKPERKQLTRHHRVPRSKGGSDSDRNISLVPCNKHEAYHLLFANLPPEDVARILNAHWIDPDYELVVQKKDSR